MLTLRSRRWFAGAAALAAFPMLAAARIQDAPDEAEPANSYTTSEFGMEIAWDAPWELDRIWDDAKFGYETVFVEISGSGEHTLALYPDLISHKFNSSKEYLDHYEEKYDPSNEDLTTISRVDLIHERTETTLTALYLREAIYGTHFVFHEQHAEPDAEYATGTMLWVTRVDEFEDLFKHAQRFVTLNGDAPFTTVDNDEVIQLANDALSATLPDDGGS